jgi:WD40-like Beta Propeller Repeat
VWRASIWHDPIPRRGLCWLLETSSAIPAPRSISKRPSTASRTCGALLSIRSLEWLRVERLTTGPGRDVAASLSSNGRRLAYATTIEQTRVYLQSLSPDGRSIAGPPTAVTESGAEVLNSSLSRDGRRLACVLRRAGSERYCTGS